LLPPPSIASELGGIVVVDEVVEVVDEILVEEVAVVVEVIDVVLEVVDELVEVVDVVKVVEEDEVEVVVDEVAEVVELTLVALEVVDELVEDVDVVKVVEFELDDRVAEVVLVDCPREKIAYRSAYDGVCLEYHTPVNVPLKVGGRVCLCEITRPESMATSGVQVDPTSVDSVA
jgi:hypothetical protein